MSASKCLEPCCAEVLHGAKFQDVPVVVAVNHADAEIDFYSHFRGVNGVPPHIRAYKALSAIAGSPRRAS